MPPTHDFTPQTSEKAPQQLSLKRTEVEAASSRLVREPSGQAHLSVIMSDDKCLSVILSD